MNYNPRDSYYKKAKQEGYRSRAAYKLVELQQRFRILRPGDSVVDLGAAPGGWLQVAAKLVGARGKVLGVDVQDITPFAEPNILLLQADVTNPHVQEQIKTLMGRAIDCVISDLAPRLTGIRDADTARAYELNQTALSAASKLLRPGGSLLLKGFVSSELQSLTAEIKKHFRSVQRTRPEATRQRSSEVYFIAKDFQPKSAREKTI
jgi:23S rRNA (uridine2552-2'-O)-methyltransferase